MSIKNTLFALALGATLATSGFSADAAPNKADEKKLTLDTVPAAVKEGIAKQAKADQVAGIEEQKREGKTVYKVLVKTGDKTSNIWFDETGAIIKEAANGAEKAADKTK